MKRFSCINSAKGWRKGLATLALVIILPFRSQFTEAKPEWHILEAPNFTVVSQTSERDTRAWATEFNQFILSLNELMQIQPRLLPKLTVVLFKKQKDFLQFRPVRPNGKPANIAGLFAREGAWSVIGLADNWEDEETRHTIFHEGVHWMQSASQQVYPLWFEEGMAELFATFRIEGNKVKWGQAIDQHLLVLSRKRMIPLEDLLLLSRSNPLFNEDQRTGVFYAESWLFVHYLMFGVHKNQQGSINEFINSLATGSTTEEAFSETFGETYAAMQKDLQGYLSGGKYKIVVRSLSVEAKISSPWREAKPSDVAVALSRLAHGANLDDLAAKYADDAVRGDPANPDGYAMRSLLKLATNQNEDGLIDIEKAVSLGAKDANALALYAYALIKKNQMLGGIPDPDARKIANLCEQAINLCPSLKLAYVNLAGIIPNIQEVNDQDDPFLTQGQALFPDEGIIRLGHAQVLRKKGNKPDANKILEDVLANPRSLPPEERPFANELKAYWAFEDTRDRVNALLPLRRWKEAVQAIDELLKQQLEPSIRIATTAKREEILLYVALDDAQSAFDEGKLDDARRQYENILAKAHAPPNVRREAHEALERIEQVLGHSSVP